MPFPRALPIKTTDEFGAEARRIYAEGQFHPLTTAAVARFSSHQSGHYS
jgi:hypothetical protein